MACATLRVRGPRHHYAYRCNGRQFAHALYGSREQRCAGRGIAGRVIEQLFWDEVAGFLPEPQQILQRLRQRLTLGESEQRRRQRELAEKRARLREKAAARERMVGLFRRGRFDAASLDADSLPGSGGGSGPRPRGDGTG